MCLLLKVEVEATPNPKKGNPGLKETFKFENELGTPSKYEHRGSDSDR